jgi:hypothetical protein
MGKQEQPQIELIINPEELLSLNNPIAALAIDKTSKYPSLSVKKLTDKVIEASFSHLDFVTYEKLRAVSELVWKNFWKRRPRDIYNLR